MRLDWLEPARRADGPLHRLDPRATLLGTLGFVVAVVGVPIGRWRPLGLAAMALAALVGISGVPAGQLLRRGLAVLPVAVLLAAMIAPSHPRAAEFGPWFVGMTIVAKNAITILAVLLLAHVTPFRSILAALAWMRVPPALVATLHLMYRYLFVLAEQLGRMARARRSRSFRRSRWADWPLGAGLISALMLRSFERGERVHSAMLARGWDGTVRSLDGPEPPETLPPMMPIAPDDRLPAAVLVRGLVYRYPDGREALRGVDLEIRPGETVALVGPNGAGKSTFLLHLNGLLPGRQGSEGGPGIGHGHEVPTLRRSLGRATAIWIDGLPVDDRHGPEIRRRVGLLFQDPDDQMFSPTVLEDVAFGPLNLGKRKAEARRIAMECLALVEMADAADRPPHHLSFGERKRACLAGVLACSPTVLVLDEPTANLDPRARRNFLALIRSLPATKLIATHDLEMVLDLCDRVALLDDGRIVADGLPEAILGDEPLMEGHGLELPLSLRMGRPIG